MPRFAHVAKALAEDGFDVIGIDQRGFGHSEGRRGLIESKHVIIEDQMEFSYEIEKTFGATKLPKFLFG